MDNYKNIEDRLIDYLKEYGYPPECIAINWGDSKMAIDVAVLSENLITPVAIYEIKPIKTEKFVERGINSLKRIASVLKTNASCFLVLGKDNGVEFEIFDVTKNVYNNEPIDLSSIMAPTPLKPPISYSNLQSGSTSKELAKKIKNRQNKIDHLKLVCWFIYPFIAAVLLVLDALNVYEFTALRLSVIGVISIFVLVPFFSEISWKDFSFKRKTDK